jgi:hypothetical protein
MDVCHRAVSQLSFLSRHQLRLSAYKSVNTDTFKVEPLGLYLGVVRQKTRLMLHDKLLTKDILA